MRRIAPDYAPGCDPLEGVVGDALGGFKGAPGVPGALVWPGVPGLTEPLELPGVDGALGDAFGGLIGAEGTPGVPGAV